jgi:hypothetical protein
MRGPQIGEASDRPEEPRARQKTVKYSCKREINSPKPDGAAMEVNSLELLMIQTKLEGGRTQFIPVSCIVRTNTENIMPCCLEQTCQSACQSPRHVSSIMPGTIRWRWHEDNGLEHKLKFNIPGSFYVSDRKMLLAEPATLGQKPR